MIFVNRSYVFYIFMWSAFLYPNQLPPLVQLNRLLKIACKGPKRYRYEPGNVDFIVEGGGVKGETVVGVGGQWRSQLTRPHRIINSSDKLICKRCARWPKCEPESGHCATQHMTRPEYTAI